jgi:hypothetical protein
MNTEMKLTDKEAQLLEYIADSDYADVRGTSDPNLVGMEVWMFDVADRYKTRKVFSGICSSLTKKGYIGTDTEGDPSMLGIKLSDTYAIWVTQEGFDALQQYNAEKGGTEVACAVEEPAAEIQVEDVPADVPADEEPLTRTNHTYFAQGNYYRSTRNGTVVLCTESKQGSTHLTFKGVCVQADADDTHEVGEYSVYWACDWFELVTDINTIDFTPKRIQRKINGAVATWHDTGNSYGLIGTIQWDGISDDYAVDVYRGKLFNSTQGNCFYVVGKDAHKCQITPELTGWVEMLQAFNDTRG